MHGSAPILGGTSNPAGGPAVGMPGAALPAGRNFQSNDFQRRERAMTREQMGHYRDRLRELADRVDRTVTGLEEGVRTPTGGQAAGGLSNAPLHLGDVGTDAYAQELDATLLENEAYIRDEVI